jgi:hypothetical protein
MPALNERMPGFKVQMGFGLHIGWAIEGAIGALQYSPPAMHAGQLCRERLPGRHEAASHLGQIHAWYPWVGPQHALRSSCSRIDDATRNARACPSGSEYKIDASYLSPNVNLASRLEAATKQFGVPLLLSQDFACSLSPAVRVRVRPCPSPSFLAPQTPSAPLP